MATLMLFAAVLLFLFQLDVTYGGGCITTEGEKCVFPFKFGLKTCVGPKCCNLDDDVEGSWCATKVDGNGKVITNHFGYCSFACSAKKDVPQLAGLNERVLDTTCISDCSSYQGKKDEYCGTNGQTYPNICELYNAVCRSDEKFDMRGKGACASDKTCISDCSSYEGKKDEYCGTNGQTYPNICELYNAVCRSGGKFDMRGKGACERPIDGETKGADASRKDILQSIVDSNLFHSSSFPTFEQEEEAFQYANEVTQSE